MTVRTIELTSGSARPVFFKLSGRAFYRLAFMAGAVLFLLAAICQPSLSAPINYGNFMGNTVMYTQVTEDALSTGDSPPLFGMPTVSGNSLDFNPVGFDANSSGGGPPDITDGQLLFGIMAKPMNGIQSITLGEAGDTTLAGLGNNATFTSATADGVLNIYEVDFVPLANVIEVPFSLTFNPFGGFFGLGNVGGGPFFHTQWAGNRVLNVAGILIGHNIPFLKGATKVSINLDNTLVAASQAGTTALIAKKDFGGLTITVNGPGNPLIPEPSSLVLAGLGLLGLLVGRRGRNV